MKIRESGILLHITSLPSPYGVGDLGPGAQRFTDFLAESKQSIWQVLPLNPVDPTFGSTPYSSISAFAGNTLLISPELLIKDGLLFEEETQPMPAFRAERIDYLQVITYKDMILDRAYQHFKSEGDHPGYDDFCEKNAFWLDDFALFKSIKAEQGGKVWSLWPEGLRDRKKNELDLFRERLKDRIHREKFLQYMFFKQWASLKERCGSKGIKIFGDMAIYVNYDSADVWAHQEIFKLDQEKKQISSAGVPPDYFSSTGQLWGNPIYRWDILKERGFDWWIMRLEHNFKLFDLLRIDHFRGLVAYWEVPAKEKSAVNGEWVEAPVDDFFSTIFRHFSSLPIVAEDLGTIDADVREIIHRYHIPGMMVLLFAFGEGMPKNPYIPHNHQKNRVIYTGTHDNNTTRGWFENEASSDEKQRLFKYLGREVTADQISWELVRMAMMSVADTAIVPMQDLLSLGEEARMNRPSTLEGNYQWRMLLEQLSPELAGRLREMTETYWRI
jgi:4-alpha-glucanotransferase